MTKQPLFLVVGGSGTGKSTVVPELRLFLSGFYLLDTDTLRFPECESADGGYDWNAHKNLCLGKAAESGLPAVLCGTMLPEEIARCGHRAGFSRVYWLALYAQPDVIEARLRERDSEAPHFSEEFIRMHRDYHAGWFAPCVAPSVDPPMVMIDTSFTSPEEIARRIYEWIAVTRSVDDAMA